MLLCTTTSEWVSEWVSDNQLINGPKKWIDSVEIKFRWGWIIPCCVIDPGNQEWWETCIIWGNMCALYQ
jgi:hypothetical protein